MDANVPDDMKLDPVLARLTDQIRAAQAARRRLQICGGCSKAFLGGAARGERLDVTALSGISRHEPSELVVTARAGTPLAELEAVLAEAGQHLAFEPPRHRVAKVAALDADLGAVVPDAVPDRRPPPSPATVGGMVAAGLAGPARAAAGSLRDHVLGATMVNGRGEVLSFGGQVMKNVAGYDVARLLAGSMGELGVIAEVSLKVLPRPVAVRTLRFELPQAEALTRLNQWAGQPLPLSASAWWSGMLVLRLAGAQAAVAAAALKLGGETVDDAMAADFWEGLRDQTDEFFTDAAQVVARGGALWRLSLPPTTPPLPLPGEPLIEWGGAQRWLVLPAKDAAVASPMVTALRAACAEAGGHAAAFRGGPRELAWAPLAEPLRSLHQRLKAAFDPAGVFNRGRLLPDEPERGAAAG